jgi:poly(A) polymerase/tRNA nucleotidyltransferase (CCA-adding enzyme)
MDPPAFRIAPPGLLADPRFRRVHGVLPEARLVGGCVRDAVAGLPVADLDLATPRSPEDVMAVLRAAGIMAVPTGLAHGTVTAVLDGRGIEITTLRRDVATDGRHATIAFTTDWREDAARRDFTINAMSMDAAGNVWDWFGGRDDLARGVVRFVGDPATRLAEDHLRGLRFFRFHARYGRGAPDPAALAAIRAAVPGLAILSAERVWSELKRILAAADPREAMRLMDETGVLAAVLPEAVARERLDALVAAGAPEDPLLRLAALCPGADVERLAERLKLSGTEAATLAALAEPAPAGEEAAWRAALAARGPETLTGAAWLAEAAGRPGNWAARRAWIAATPRPVFPLRGADVLAEGVAPGPRVGAVLAALERRWAEAGCRDDAATLRRWLRETLAASGGA